MADVYLAVQEGPSGVSRLVVMKRLRAPLAARAELRRTLVDEARVLARLSHPNLVQLVELGEEAQGPFLVVEYLSGETLLGVLRALAARGAHLPWPAVCRIGADLAAGLAAAHRQVADDGSPAPILHRDLTPSNVIVCWTGAVKLIDFGIAKEEGAGDTRIGTVKGKLSYLAPELFGGGRADPRSDLWQLGVVLHEAASGRRLFEATDDAARVQAVLRRPIPPLRQVAGDVPVDLERLVRHLLSRDPARRPASADLVRRELEDTMHRAGSFMTSHQLGDWLRDAIPSHLADRDRRERFCLATAPSLDQAADTVIMPFPPVHPNGRRWKRITLLAALAALAAAIGSSAAAIGSSAAAARRAVPAAAAPSATVRPEPIVRPLVDGIPEPDPDAVPEPDPDPDAVPEPDPDAVPVPGAP
jgi:serine/threonine-protein kinase